MQATDAPVMIISADGHATAKMRDYRTYIDAAWRTEFDAFCDVYDQYGAYSHDARALLSRTDPEAVDQWVTDVLAPGHNEGDWDPHRRLQQLDRDGLTGEVLIPDFGLPFEISSVFHAAKFGFGARSQEQVEVAGRAYNRWLADFIGVAPARFAGMASVSFANVEQAVREIRRARADGLKGVMLPMFPDDEPIFSPRYDPIWETLTELEMPVNSHVSVSGVSDKPIKLEIQPPHPACLMPLLGQKVMFNCHELFTQLIWGGVLERHPQLTVVLTEQGSAWILSTLAAFDYSWEHSYMRHDVREVAPRKPSEYFARQCFLGSSLLTKAEIEARHALGVDRMTFGVDYPHHEGTWWVGNGTRDYVRATFGAAGVPLDEARKILGETAAGLWGFDTEALAPVVGRVGPLPEDLLAPPTEDKYERGDVHKPLLAGQR